MQPINLLLAWSDELKTGIDIIDQQHKGLVDLANQTAAKLSSIDGLSIDDIRYLLGVLTNYAANHFSTEEALMALDSVDERHLHLHRQSHARFLERVECMLDALGEQGVVTGYQMVEFLRNWLIYHMNGDDQQLWNLLQHEIKK